MLSGQETTGKQLTQPKHQQLLSTLTIIFLNKMIFEKEKKYIITGSSTTLGSELDGIVNIDQKPNYIVWKILGIPNLFIFSKNSPPLKRTIKETDRQERKIRQTDNIQEREMSQKDKKRL